MPLIGNQRKDNIGRFTRTTHHWSPERWDEGHLMISGNKKKRRMMVYFPDHPRANRYGYILRSHAVWFITTGETITKEMALHHKNGDKLDDKFENLELMRHGEHTKFHCLKKGTNIVCEICGITFNVPDWRITQRIKETGSPPKYCSQGCYRKRNTKEDAHV
jgi:hypothetical protein